MRTVLPYHRSAQVYDALLGRDMLPRVIRSFETLVRRYCIPFHTLADVACGTGGFVRYLSRRGVPVVGVDLSPAMIALAQRRNQHSRADFLVQDMRRLRLPCPVDLITCHFDALNYLLTIRDLQRAFRAFHRNLTPSGHLVFDMMLDSGRPWRFRRRVLRIARPGLRSVWTITTHPRERVRRVVMQHMAQRRDGTLAHECEVHRQRAYPLGVIRQALHRGGFSVLGMHRMPSLPSATAMHTPRVVFVARRQGVGSLLP